MYKTVIIIIIAILISFTLCTVEKTNYNAHILFENRNLNVGEIPYKSDGEYLFKFYNVGKEKLKIESVSLSCSCISAEWPKYEINQKDTSIITVTTNTGRLGRFKESIAVHYNGIESPERLTISGNIVYKKSD
ncbi:MAG TPA: DUF1573 domain-containing protein [Draconibacterium sp.]|nr:DUF1573 domain-containing protein [Draconibacterium sp.]